MTQKIVRPYNWKDREPVYIKIEDLTADQKYKLCDSQNFCMIPWIHMHGWPDGKAYPCCLGEDDYPIGDLKTHTIKEIWNQEPLREMRRNMLADQPSKQCVRCYEQESNGFTSMRNNTNKHFGQHISIIDETQPDGTLPTMKFRYWDIRFSNICNLKCRSCGGIFSSRWYDDDVKLNKGKPLRPRVQFAGRHNLDILEQMQEHIPFLDQIYFAGGEPLIMEEHNKILKALIESKNTDLRLIYNTNLTELRFKKESVLDLWKYFPNVCVAASLDDMGNRAELIRSGTVWAEVEQNIRDLKRECPHIDFMISSTLSVLNIWNFVKFHRYMVDQGFIRPHDFNVNILQSPMEYRIDILPKEIKEKLIEEFENHLEWLRPQDTLNRAVGGFESACKFMMANHATDQIEKFWKTSTQLDWCRKEQIIEIIPELACIADYKADWIKKYENTKR